MSLTRDQKRIQDLHINITSKFEDLGYTLISHFEDD
jgi:hypothetical protein